MLRSHLALGSQPTPFLSLFIRLNEASRWSVCHRPFCKEQSVRFSIKWLSFVALSISRHIPPFRCPLTQPPFSRLQNCNGVGPYGAHFQGKDKQREEILYQTKAFPLIHRPQKLLKDYSIMFYLNPRWWPRLLKLRRCDGAGKDNMTELYIYAHRSRKLSWRVQCRFHEKVLTNSFFSLQGDWADESNVDFHEQANDYSVSSPSFPWYSWSSCSVLLHMGFSTTSYMP